MPGDDRYRPDDDPAPAGSGGLGANPAITRSVGSVTRQSIALTVEDDVGVPQPVDVSGEIAGGTFVGNIAIADLGVPFSAAVD